MDLMDLCSEPVLIHWFTKSFSRVLGTLVTRSASKYPPRSRNSELLGLIAEVKPLYQELSFIVPFCYLPILYRVQCNLEILYFILSINNE